MIEYADTTTTEVKAPIDDSESPPVIFDSPLKTCTGINTDIAQRQAEIQQLHQYLLSISSNLTTQTILRSASAKRAYEMLGDEDLLCIPFIKWLCNIYG